MLGEKHLICDASAILLQQILHIIATTASQLKKINKNTLPSQALTAGRFQLALVDMWPDCCYLQLHLQPVVIYLFLNQVLFYLKVK